MHSFSIQHSVHRHVPLSESDSCVVHRQLPLSFTDYASTVPELMFSSTKRKQLVVTAIDHLCYLMHHGLSDMCLIGRFNKHVRSQNRSCRTNVGSEKGEQRRRGEKKPTVQMPSFKNRAMTLITAVAHIGEPTTRQTHEA